MFLCKPRKEKDLIEKMEHDGCETEPAGFKNLKKQRKKKVTPKGRFPELFQFSVSIYFVFLHGFTGYGGIRDTGYCILYLVEQV